MLSSFRSCRHKFCNVIIIGYYINIFSYYEQHIKIRKEYRDLVICNSCQWSSSLLRDSYTFSKCPMCMADNIEVIPVEDYEKYILNVQEDRGIDVEFSDDKTRSR